MIKYFNKLSAKLGSFPDTFLFIESTSGHTAVRNVNARDLKENGIDPDREVEITFWEDGEVEYRLMEGDKSYQAFTYNPEFVFSLEGVTEEDKKEWMKRAL